LGNKEDQLKIRLRNFIRHVFKDDFPVFMVCLIIALLMWIAVKLSKENTYSIRYPVVFSNIPEGAIIDEVSSQTLLLEIELNGADLVRQKFVRSHSPLIISIKDLPVRKADSLHMIRLATNTLTRDIERQLDVLNAVNRISPDTVYIGLLPDQQVLN